jgi:6-phosphofructokinase 1
LLELAGPREKIFFDPAQTVCGIVTCGGLCPGINDVIRAIFFGLFYYEAEGAKNGMSGRTNMVVGLWNHQITHVPIRLVTSKRKRIDTEGWLWSSVLASTGQPTGMV